MREPCNSGYPSNKNKVGYINYHRFPEDINIRRKWIQLIPRKNWSWSKHQRLCSRHFTADDYQVERIDKNSSKRKKKCQQVKRKVLKNGVVPSLWPGLPSHLSKTPTIQRTTKHVSSESRREQCSILDNLNDVVSDLKEIDKKIIKSKLPDHVHKIVEDQHISFIKLLWTPSKPNIEYCLKVDSSLEYQVWLRDVKLSETDIRGKYFPVGAVNSVPSVTNILSTLEELNDHKSEEKLVDNLVDELKHTSLWEDAKIKFLCEQMMLAIKPTHGRRYSQDVLALACMWQNVTPALYKQIQADEILTLPNYKYVRRLSSALTVDFHLSDSTILYLSARMAKLSQRELNVNLIIDEVYCQKSVQYSNGVFYGNENNSITKTLLCVMIKSVAGSYRDVVIMSPVSEINHDKIYKVWKNVVEKMTEIGFDIVATMTDGHKSNMKMFKHNICQGKLNTSISNPYDVEKKIALLFDPTHLLKCVYNNFRCKESFLCPPFDGN